VKEMLYVHYPSGRGEDEDEDEHLDEKGKRKKLNESLTSDAMASGMDSALNCLSKADLMAITAELGLKPEEGKSPTARHVLKKLLFEKATDEDDLQDFFDSLSASSLQKFVTALEVKSKDEILDWITERGLTLFLSQFAVAELQQWMGDIKLDGSKCSSKKQLIECFIHGKDAPAPKAKPKKAATAVSKTKPDLAKGITALDAFNWYKRQELDDYCKKHKLPTNGKLKAVAKRVADHLNGVDVKPKKADGKGKKRKRGADTTGKKRPAKKQKTSKKEEGKEK